MNNLDNLISELLKKAEEIRFCVKTTLIKNNRKGESRILIDAFPEDAFSLNLSMSNILSESLSLRDTVLINNTGGPLINVQITSIVFSYTRVCAKFYEFSMVADSQITEKMVNELSEAIDMEMKLADYDNKYDFAELSKPNFSHFLRRS